MKKKTVCDGVVDCSNGRDEEDCFLLVSSLTKPGPATAVSEGYLAVWSAVLSGYLPVGAAQGEGWDILQAWSKEACAGVVGSEPSVELLPGPGSYEGEVAVIDYAEGVVVMDRGEYEIVSVDCGGKMCGTSSARNKRDLGFWGFCF